MWMASVGPPLHYYTLHCFLSIYTIMIMPAIYYGCESYVCVKDRFSSYPRPLTPIVAAGLQMKAPLHSLLRNDRKRR